LGEVHGVIRGSEARLFGAILDLRKMKVAGEGVMTDTTIWSNFYK
jgi:hypothetical protein